MSTLQLCQVAGVWRDVCTISASLARVVLQNLCNQTPGSQIPKAGGTRRNDVDVVFALPDVVLIQHELWDALFPQTIPPPVMCLLALVSCELQRPLAQWEISWVNELMKSNKLYCCAANSKTNLLLFAVCPALLRGVLDSTRVGEDPGRCHRSGVRFCRAVCGPAPNILLFSAAR